MVKLTQIKKNSYNSYILTSVYVNPKHIVFMAEGASRIQLTKFLLAMETGDFFNKRTGLINQSLGL